MFSLYKYHNIEYKVHNAYNAGYEYNTYNDYNGNNVPNTNGKINYINKLMEHY